MTVSATEKGRLALTEEKVNHLALIWMEKGGKKDKWQKAVAFPFGDPAYNFMHPCLTEDGKTLYFASDMPGGEGGTDIYRCTRTSDGWSKPENLGQNVNSKANEVYPYIHQNGSLFFSSDRAGGMGDLDIWYTPGPNPGRSTAINPGSPLNSAWNDFGIAWKGKKAMGFFTSNRNNPAGKEDIYHFSYRVPCTVKVVDSLTGAPLAGTEVELLRLKGTNKTMKTNAAGEIQFDIGSGLDFVLRAVAPEFAGAEKRFSTNRLQLMEPFQGTFALQSGSVLEFTVGPENKADKIEEWAVQMVGGDGKTKIFSSKSKTLRVPVNPGQDHHAELKASGFESKLLSFRSADLLGKPVTRINVEMQRVRGVGGGTGTGMNFNPASGAIAEKTIYFDYNQAILPDSAALQFSDVIAVLKSNPEAIVVLLAFTDCRGSENHNLDLSRRRAAAGKKFLEKAGIAGHRILASGVGEIGSGSECCEKKDCPDAIHRKNRRLEVTIRNSGASEIK